MGFSRQEYWGGLPFPFPGDLLHPGIKPRSPTMQADSSLSEPAGRVLNCCKQNDQLVKWVNGQVIVHWWSVLSCQNFPLFSLTFLAPDPLPFPLPLPTWYARHYVTFHWLNCHGVTRAQGEWLSSVLRLPLSGTCSFIICSLPDRVTQHLA